MSSGARGTTLLEVLVALALAASTAAAVLSTANTASLAREHAARRLSALEIAEEWMERLRAGTVVAAEGLSAPEPVSTPSGLVRRQVNVRRGPTPALWDVEVLVTNAADEDLLRLRTYHPSREPGL